MKKTTKIFFAVLLASLLATGVVNASEVEGNKFIPAVLYDSPALGSHPDIAFVIFHEIKHIIAG